MGTTGHCLCGAVSYRAEEVNTDIHICHCGICRRWTGGPAFAASVGKVTFDGAQHITRYDSSEWAQRGFCNRCGSNLFYYLKESDQYILWMGSFDDQQPFKVAGEIYIDEKPSTYAMTGDHPRMTGEQFMAMLTPQK